VNIVFDFGAVLFAWEPRVLARQFFPAQAGTDAQAAALAKSLFGHNDWQAFDAGLVSAHDLVARIHARTALPAQVLHQLVAHIGPHLAPIADSVAVLHGLRQRRDAGEPIRLYYLSNMPEPYARLLEDKHDFIGWFDGGIFSSDVKLIKPDAAIFQLASERFGLHGPDTVFIDDLPANIEAARTHGWRGVHLPQPADLRHGLKSETGL
jgi:putative hydrolase of the HAD superfamily